MLIRFADKDITSCMLTTTEQQPLVVASADCQLIGRASFYLTNPRGGQMATLRLREAKTDCELMHIGAKK